MPTRLFAGEKENALTCSTTASAGTTGGDGAASLCEGEPVELLDGGSEAELVRDGLRGCVAEGEGVAVGLPLGRCVGDCVAPCEGDSDPLAVAL